MSNHVELLVTIYGTDGYKSGYVTLGLTDSAETISGKAVTIGLRDENSLVASVDADPADLIDAAALIMEAVPEN